LALWLNTVLIWTDAILVRLLRGERAVGWYAAGNRAGLALAMLAAFYVQGAFPLLSRASQEGLVQFRRLFQHCYEDMALVFVPGSIWGIVYAHDIVLLVFKKPEYLAAVPVFQTFQIFVLVTALASLHGIGVLAAFHRDREYRRAYIVATAVFIPLCVALTLFLGILGAALAVVFAQLLALILFVRASQGLVRAHHISALAVPLALGVLVTMACRLLGVTVLWSAALLVVCNLGLLGLRFRKNYLHEALS
jgi:O-antigen/teichoic acid export membrane protein